MMPGGMGGGSGGGHGSGGTGFGGQTGIFRIFNNDFGPNVAWLLVLALAGGGLLLWILRKTPRTNRGRAAVIFWMLWLLIHVVIFSMTSGVIHPYYVLVMAPAVATLVGISLPFLWGAYTRRKPYAWLLPVLVGLAGFCGDDWAAGQSLHAAPVAPKLSNRRRPSCLYTRSDSLYTSDSQRRTHW